MPTLRPLLLARNRADGWYCQKCSAVVQGESTRHHYRAVHQPTSFIRLPGSAAKVRVDRDPQTRRFKCPRIGCLVSLELAQEVQDHARKCTKPLHCYPEEPSSEKRPNGSALHTSASASRRYAGRYSNAGATSASPLKGDSLSARTLRVHTAHLPQTTRTKRALIRHCYAAGDMMISEIAEFVGCDHRTVWAVVRNEVEDDLKEDEQYLNCEVGDIVNVEALGEVKPFVKREPVEDDNALLRVVPDEEGYDSEAEVEDQYIPPSLDTPPLRRKRQLSVESDVSMLSSLTSLADAEDLGTDVPMSSDSTGDDASPSHAHFESASPGPSSTVYSNGTHGSPATSKLKASDGVVEAFMRSLGGPSDRLIQLFYEMEIDNAEHLDWLCTMQEDYWDDVKDYLLRNGVKLFHWLVVKKGLRDRAAALAADGGP